MGLRSLSAILSCFPILHYPIYSKTPNFGAMPMEIPVIMEVYIVTFVLLASVSPLFVACIAPTGSSQVDIFVRLLHIQVLWDQLPAISWLRPDIQLIRHRLNAFHWSTRPRTAKRQELREYISKNGAKSSHNTGMTQFASLTWCTAQGLHHTVTDFRIWVSCVTK